LIEGRAIVHEVEYPDSIERVWRALVDPEELAIWLMPNDFVALVGHQFSMDCGPIGRIEAEILEIDPPHLLACRWVGSFGDTVVTFQLTSTGTGTRLRIDHRGWSEASAAQRDQFDTGWPGKVDALRRLLEGRHGTITQGEDVVGDRAPS
jgi:uncharacterized protein YndB with AHSA1/START domain